METAIKNQMEDSPELSTVIKLIKNKSYLDVKYYEDDDGEQCPCGESKFHLIKQKNI